jgi:hypothetical protein
MQRFYSKPVDTWIQGYETEIIELLKKGYIDTVTYGFKRNGSWVEPTLRYRAKDLEGMDSADDDPGRVMPNANIEGAEFHSYLTFSTAWAALTSGEKSEFERNLPFIRTGASEPGVNGYLVADKSYSSGGKALNRSTLKSY